MKRFTLSLLGLCAAAPAVTAEDRVLTDFGSKGMPLQWFSVNDGVMGGRSSGSFRVVDGVLRFTGVLNTNGGGFASIRTRSTDLGLGGTEGIHLRVKGDGRTYSARLQESDTMRSASYRAEFKTTKTGEWQDVWLPFRSFVASWRGRTLDLPPIDPAKIQLIGITIADKKDGAFSLDVDSISAYAPFSMERYRWKSGPLVLFAPDGQDKRLREQIASVLESAAPFAERGMVLIVVLESGPSYAGTRPIAAEQAAALRKQYNIDAGSFALKLVGKDGGVKRSESEPISPLKLYPQIDSMPMRQREMSGD
jgi:hypothetical protein